MEVPAISGMPVKGRRGSTRVSGPRSSSKLSRNSSTSRSIKIFADMKDLLGIRGSSHIRLPDDAERKSGFRSPSPSIHEAYLDRENGHGVTHEQVEPTHNVQLNEEGDDQKSPGTEEQEASTTFLESDSEAGRITGTPDLYDSFPRPPGQVLQRHHQDLLSQPEIPGLEPGSPVTSRLEIIEKYSPRVDKLLPQPPYHSFTHKKKLMVAALVSLAGSLSPLSSIIYFPALNAISTVSLVSSCTAAMLMAS